MSKSLSIKNIKEDIRSKIYTQNYSHKTNIEGVKIIPLTNHPGEEGDFSEIVKIDKDNQVVGLPNFTVVQINRTKLNPKSIKAWHLHFSQDEVWYVIPSCELMVGLWDVREESPTKNATMRIVLGGGNSQLLFIPKGVAHGSSNFSGKETELFYFTNQRFDIKNPDEHRIPWDALGDRFWSPKKD
ncbi:MAG: dTDP-4-dehydrorhamnose 3,5-epimerase family protein [Patescibacteria group bacterium]